MTSRTLLVVNPNISDAITSMIDAEARAVCGPKTVIRSVTAPFGVEYVETDLEAHIAAHACAQVIAAAFAEVDAVIVAAFGDPGLPALRQLAKVPMIGLTEAAVAAVRSRAVPVSVVCVSDRMIPWYRQAIERQPGSLDLRSIRAIGPLHGSISAVRDDSIEQILGQIEAARHVDGARAVILAGAPLAGFARRHQAEASVPLIDGLDEAVRLAERSNIRSETPGLLATKVARGVSPALASRLGARVRER